MTFQEFQAHLAEMHKRSGDEVMMYNCAKVVDAENSIFSYAYDALCVEILQFMADGSVLEWCDADEGDHEHYEPHFQHANVEEWMNDQIAAVAYPD